MQIGSVSYVSFAETKDSAQLSAQTSGELSERESTVSALNEPEQSDDSGSQSEQKPSSEAIEPRYTDQELDQISQLEARDREVRTHEQAHQSAGGQYAGAASFTYQRGPDGVNYAVGGEVPIDIAPIEGNPQATIEKADTVRRAALAPAEPSAQDRAVAAQAVQIKLEAQSEIRNTELESGESDEESLEESDGSVEGNEAVVATDTETQQSNSDSSTEGETDEAVSPEISDGSLSPEDFTYLLASDVARRNALAVFENINAEPPKINLDELV